MCRYKKMFLISSMLFMGYLNQPTHANASGTLVVDERRHGRHGSYTEISVGADRFYYDSGTFYRRNADDYVVVDAPVGAVIYNVPYGYQRVYFDGDVYYVYRDVYYRPIGRGYQVVSRPRGHGYGHRHHGRDDDRDEHREDRRW